MVLSDQEYFAKIDGQDTTQEVWQASRWDHNHATADETRAKYPDIWEEVEQRFLGGYYSDDFAAMIVERADQAGYNCWSLADHIVSFIEDRVFEYPAT